ncbi:glycosyl transferase, group 1 [Crocosphaera subtropica ATCC 51142]|uniref:Glycosyl transferase, group 1 n=1 Tax=Crocosphaera subtropica (strain ATCC 51142 / BH68) TaxID=43989 RepID=B1WP85_CROS5|nr:glycosyltransferase [Crocosphaera subtropica]ACB49867.1 glycosyl transferase, group 1 [Crocosphaera subtropica ATCC 51142]
MTTNTTKSELNFIIDPEIKNDDFYQAIQEIARYSHIKTVLEIGSSSGQGSTEAFVKGLRENPNQPTLFCMEVSQTRFNALKNYYLNDSFVKCYNVSSIAINQFPDEATVTQFYDSYQTPLNEYPLDRVLGWLRQDIDYVKDAEVAENGIEIIKQENNIQQFDLVLIDGSEFTGAVELDQVYGAKIILLDDICTYKNWQSHHRLLSDPNYKLIQHNPTLRNGYSIFIRVDSLSIYQPPVTPLEEQPIHFFTIVLNGQPFIEYHINVLRQLPFKWHWHIIEGVAELRHDTAWSLAAGGEILEKIHNQGCSVDGTTEYLDNLQQQYPDNITIYRKQKGQFWDGKREMVNAPLTNIKEDCLLWQIDVDELWTVEQIIQAKELFNKHPEKTSAYFWCWYFVGEKLIISSRYCYTQNPHQEWLRVWRFQPGDSWEAHEPPRLVRSQPDGQIQDVAKINPFLHKETEKYGLLFQHFAYVTPDQLDFKESYYGYENALQEWKDLQEATDFPVFLKDYLSWVSDNTIAEPADICGIVPLMQRNTNDQTWHFLTSQEIQEKTMSLKKPFPQIVIDGVFFQFANSGIAQVWKSLLECWSENGFYQHIIVLDRAGTAPRIPNIRYRPVPAFDYTQTDVDSRMLQEICDEKGADLFISTYYTIPLSTPSVFMGYDMIPEVMGVDLDNVGWREKHYGIMHASSYITISENTAYDLTKFFPHISPDNVTVAHCGLKSVFSPASDQEIDNFKQKYNIDKPYVLLVGERMGVNSYKNAIYLFRTFSKLVNKKEFSIVCVGGKSELEPELVQLSQDVTTHVLPLEDEELKRAYSGALVYICTSKYEGFGLPILEAMACGCPVITSCHSSIPEVAGDAALYVEQSNECDLMDALYKVQNPEIRQQLIKAGFEQIQQFSWSKMADIMADVFLKTANKIKQEKTELTPPIWNALRKQQSLVKQANNLVEQTQQELANIRHQVQQYQQALEECRQQSQNSTYYSGEITRLQQQLEVASTEIEAMKTSKFWKLRGKWFSVKQKLGLPIDDV